MTRRRKSEIEAKIKEIRKHTHNKPRPRHTMLEIWSARVILLFIALMLGFMTLRCSHAPEPKPTEYVIKIDSDIPVVVHVYKSCEGNYNFCQWD